MSIVAFQNAVRQGLPTTLPTAPPLEDGIDRAPKRTPNLTRAEEELALRNALRYLPPAWHAELAPEFAQELREDGHIYMRRFRPDYPMHARPLQHYPAQNKAAAAIQLMIQNNLDPAVAQHPYELVTYGGNGSVFQNWAQYLLAMKLLAEMTDEQTLVLYSGHPMGLFPSHPDAPRVILTNGMMVPEYSTLPELERLNALGVTQYGQMTAGSFMYIGPQGIVHGTTLTLLNAGRKYLGSADLGGKVYVTSGLGGMSGAQAKAAVIAGAIGVVAEVNPVALHKRHAQGWVQEVETDMDKVLSRIERARKAKEPLSLGVLGNVVDLWERLVDAGMHIELGSDQTSLHNPWNGGYYPSGLTVEEARVEMQAAPDAFKERVQDSLRRQVTAINTLSDAGMSFWDYGNAFLVQARDAGADVTGTDTEFRYPSYVEDIMGPICFDYGFGPFRWVCASGDPEDLRKTDAIAADVLKAQAAIAPDDVKQQLLDNVTWIEAAEDNAMVVGSQARILYADHAGRRAIARAFHDAIAAGELGPVVLGRDHHDVSGTDSPWRETANIKDGSRFTADMAVHNVIGDAVRGASWVSLHNGGGVGWGRVMNGGFGMLLDGTPDSARKADSMLDWDVANGVARRAWARNEGAVTAIQRAMDADPRLKVTLPQLAEDQVIQDALG